MNEIAIHVENLGKLYRIGERQQYKTLRDALANTFTAPFRKVKQSLKSKDESQNYIWALKNISFEIKKGKVVGVIGRNGAGKSTLLKILSRITPPTEGYVQIYGRVSSLLEVGTGFHPELTGRDNIYLNGVILGMKKAQINREFDEIVAFAELEKFIDTPLKHYSTGMKVRLAFAVAAHLKQEILLVDEVLAVGDVVFQKKCLGRMEKVAKEGRTVVFVSHNMSAIRKLCDYAVLLNAGQTELIDSADQCVKFYLQGNYVAGTTEVDTSSLMRPSGLGESLRFLRVKLLSEGGSDIYMGKSFGFEFQFQVLEKVTDVAIGFGVDTLDAIRILDFRSTDVIPHIKQLLPGIYRIRMTIENNLLLPGEYTITIGASSDTRGVPLDLLDNVLKFRILPLEVKKTLDYYEHKKEGFFLTSAQWTEPLPDNGH